MTEPAPIDVDHSDLRAKVGRAVAKFRHAKGLSLKQASPIIGISPQAIGMIERGVNFPSIVTVFRLWRDMGLSIDGLFVEITTPTHTRKRK